MVEALSHLASGMQDREPGENPPRTVVLIEPMAEEQVVLLAEELLAVLIRRASGQGSELPFRPP